MSLYHDILDEAARADARFGVFRSTHEGYGVLAEEVAELLDAIRANNQSQIRLEAIQVAAVACRLVMCLEDDATRSRSGLTA